MEKSSTNITTKYLLFGKGTKFIQVWQNFQFCANCVLDYARYFLFSLIKLCRKTQTTFKHNALCCFFDSVMDIEVNLTFSQCYQQFFFFIFEWRLGIGVSKSQRQYNLEQIWTAPLLCIISRFYLKCFTCTSEPQQYPQEFQLIWNALVQFWE